MMQLGQGGLCCELHTSTFFLVFITIDRECKLLYNSLPIVGQLHCPFLVENPLNTFCWIAGDFSRVAVSYKVQAKLILLEMELLQHRHAQDTDKEHEELLRLVRSLRSNARVHTRTLCRNSTRQQGRVSGSQVIAAHNQCFNDQQHSCCSYDIVFYQPQSVSS